MRLPQRLANANRHVTNPIMRPLARRVAPLAVIHHVGRRSGVGYRSPVLAFGVPGGYLIPLTYGPERDWVRNIVSAGTFELERRGRTMTVTRPVVRPGDHVEGLHEPWSSLVRRLNLDGVLTVERATR
jgi:deazaflavin-dependent oxidoreductase (nitroreductase family)